jgi:site-specific recombinase XerD
MNSSFAKFLDEYQSSELTRKAYRQSLELFDRFLSGKEPTERLVEEFMLSMEKRGMASSSVNRHLAAIRAYFLWRKKRSPPDKRGLFDLMVKGPKVHSKLPKAPNAEQITKLRSVCKTPYDRALVMTLYDGALRIAELMGLTDSDVDYTTKAIKILGKGGDEWKIPVGEETLKALQEYIGTRQGKIFTQPYYQLRYDLRKLGNAAGIKGLNPHQLRHARASNLFAQDVSDVYIQELMRHRNINTTRHYIHVQPDQLRKHIPAAF